MLGECNYSSDTDAKAAGWSCVVAAAFNTVHQNSKRRTDAVPAALHTNLKKVDKNKFGAIGKVNAPSKLLRVGVDVDEVLGSFLSGLNTFIAEEYLQQHKESEYHVYDFMKIWRCSQAVVNDRVHAFFESEHFNRGISPIPGAHEALQNLSFYCHIVVVTSRQHVIRQPTLDWINQHYNGIF
uniref:Uncharacterized protein n=1 Tax=Physcomitrium patens TaxID=3218 RepID=A0A7I4FSI0_PHYPA